MGMSASDQSGRSAIAYISNHCISGNDCGPLEKTYLESVPRSHYEGKAVVPGYRESS